MMLGWPNGSGGSLQSCSIWVQLPSPALWPNPMLSRDYFRFLNSFASSKYRRESKRKKTAAETKGLFGRFAEKHRNSICCDDKLKPVRPSSLYTPEFGRPYPYPE